MDIKGGVMGSAIDIVGRAMDRLQQTRMDGIKVKEAREGLEHERQLFDLKRKEAEIQLETAKVDGRMSKNDLIIQESYMKDLFDKQDKVLDGKTAMNELAGSQVEQEAQKHQRMIDILTPAAQQETMTKDGYQSSLLQWKQGRGGHYVPSIKKQEEEKENPKLGEALADIDGVALDRKEAERTALGKLGTKWREKYPDVEKTINARFGPDDLPDNVTQTSQAIRYLMNEYGMDKEKAISWVNDKYGKKQGKK